MTQRLFPATSTELRIGKVRRSQAERTALSDTLMFQAAMEIIAERGTHGLTLKEVGEKAGYSRGLASIRFGSKTNLFNELILAASTRYQAVLDERVGSARGLDALCSYIDFWSEMLREDWREFKSLNQLSFEALGGETTARGGISTNHVILRAKTERWITEAVEDGDLPPDSDAATITLCCGSLLTGFVYRVLASPDAIGITDSIESVLAAWWKLLGRDRPGATLAKPTVRAVG